jgi:hypothetical protein
VCTSLVYLPVPKNRVSGTSWIMGARLPGFAFVSPPIIESTVGGSEASQVPFVEAFMTWLALPSEYVSIPILQYRRTTPGFRGHSASGQVGQIRSRRSLSSLGLPSQGRDSYTPIGR